MTNEVTQLETLQAWWDNTSFPGKEFCDLKDNGDLVLRKTAVFGERVITSMSVENAEAAIKALVEKFPEVQARVKEVQAEWEAADDKLKLMGKVARLRDYLMHTNAIGDFNSLMVLVDEWDKVIALNLNGVFYACK
ncbi:MAG: hypothetical protein EOP49_09165, partial [Sphingobacteriales bacterium]